MNNKKVNEKTIPKNPCEMEFKLTIDCETYFDIYRVIKEQIFLSVVMGGRGIGKTEQCNGLVLDEFKNNGDEFIYLRRYKSELKGANTLLDKWIDDIVTTSDGNGGGNYYWHKNRIGWFIPLSIHTRYKSGFDFSKVKTIIYDEAIIKPTATDRYLTDEVTQLLEFCSTVFRHRTDVRVIVLGNNLIFFNPFCEFFKVKVFNGKFIDRDRGVQIIYSKDSAKLRAIEENTPLYKLTKGTAYHDYHYNNNVIANESVTISDKNNNDKIELRCLLNTYTMNIYSRQQGRMLIESKNKIIEDGISYRMLQNNEPNYLNINMFKNNWYNLLFYKYYRNEIDYTSQDAYNLFQEFMILF